MSNPITKARWQRSVAKWKKIVSMLENGVALWEVSEYANRTKCGYCSQFFVKYEKLEELGLDGDMACAECPLSKRKICSDYSQSDIPYWQVWEEDDNNKRIAAAKKVLTAIMKDEPK